MRNPAPHSRGVVAVVLAAVLLAPAAGRAQTKLSGIGDSIMQGANARLSWWPPPGDQPQYSFAQGNDSTVNPLYRRYRALGKLPLGEQFVSRDGAEMVGGSNNAPAQALRVCSQTVKPDRIVLELGGNDICNRSSMSTLYAADTFEAALTQALEILASPYPSCGLPAGTRIHVLTMPAVNYLYQAGIDKQWSTGIPCQVIWYSANICPTVTFGSSADRTAIAQLIDDYNARIAKAVAAAQSAHPSILFTTDYKGSMSSAPNTSIGTYRLAGRDLSDIDCFHPKWSTGQKKLACAAWETWEYGSGNEAGCFTQ